MNAFGLHLADNLMDRIYGKRKRTLYASLPNQVVEIGPGSGANLRYYAAHTRLIAIEPNNASHAHLKAKALKYGIDLEIKSGKGERINLPDNSVDAVVGTLVLCSVDNPSRVLAEIRRILKPGGRYIYLEHVSDIQGTWVHRLQKGLHFVWHRLFEGCHLSRATHLTIQQAGFRRVEMDCFRIKASWLPFSPHIVGIAFN